MITLVDDELEGQLVDPVARKRWLLLDRHPDFPGHWIVEGFNKQYLCDLGSLVGSYRAVAPAGLENFLALAEKCEYQVAFFDDPGTLLEEYASWNQEPEVAINSTFENTVNGMLPYQVQGYNMLKELKYGVARWATGCGQTAVAAALIQYQLQQDGFEICFFVVKKNNKINTVRKLKQLGGIDALYIRGPKEQRERYYGELREWMGREYGTGWVVVLNYEQFRDDFVYRDAEGSLQLSEWGEAFFPGRDLMFIWDEMPTKLKTRTSVLYKAVCKCLYRTNPPQVKREQLRPRSMRSYMLSATPIENNPQDWFACIRLMDGGATYGTVSEFNDTYVRSWNDYDPTKPEEFHELERMRLKAAHFVHQVNKEDPDVAAVFPKAVPELVYIDWDQYNASVYNEIQDLVARAAMDEKVEDIPIFSLIGALQMICDAPEMVNDSAARREVYEDALEAWEASPEGRRPGVDGSEFALALPEDLRARLRNKGHPKIEKLKEILLERHPTDQVAIYARFNKALMPYLKAALEGWGVSYGHYTGQQAVQDAFQDGRIRVFLASDSGSDSIDLDAGNVVIDYDLPWKWTTVVQRHNRVHRPTSSHDTVYYYTLVMEGSVEERVLQIIEKKRGYHNALFDPAAGDVSANARMTKEELMWILTG